MSSGYQVYKALKAGTMDGIKKMLEERSTRDADIEAKALGASNEDYLEALRGSGAGSSSSGGGGGGGGAASSSSSAAPASGEHAYTAWPHLPEEPAKEAWTRAASCAQPTLPATWT